ncbi:MAG: o-succinylbenzoate synthase [Gemmatimonadota bacterium]
MRIEGFELIEIKVRLREAFASSVESRRERRLLLLRAEGEEGGEGWAECVAGETPSYTAETTTSAWHILSEFILPKLIGTEILGPEDLQACMGWIRGHPMARATAEMAAWDLQARELGVSLWELIGGTGEGVPVGVSLGIHSDLPELLDRVERQLDAGYASVKLKIAPGWDVEIVRAVRERFPTVPLMVDANGAFSLADLPVFEALDELTLELVEQPFPPDDLVGHARLQEQIATPVCLDESIESADDARTALELRACGVVSVKPGRVGGLGPARSILEICREREVGVRCGGMLETGIGRAHALALATLPGFTHAADLSASARYWEHDIVIPAFELDEGRLRPHPGAGIGVEPDRDRIRALTERGMSFGTLVRPVVQEF